VLKSRKTALAVRLASNRWVHHLVAFLRVYSVAGAFLRQFPIQKRVHQSSLVYRITSLDEITTESEIFIHQSYAPALPDTPVGTFIDLGCNAGWFALWLVARGQPVRAGLLIDAHPRMIDEARWHLDQNGLSRFVLVHGAVGLAPTQASTTFHLHPTTSASSAMTYDPAKQLPVKGRIVDVEVPVVSVSAEWAKHCRDAIVDLLKIDIEGMELALVINEGSFLQRRVRRVVVEWHKWSTSIHELDEQFAIRGFQRIGVYEESEVAGLAAYQNPSDVRL